MEQRRRTLTTRILKVVCFAILFVSCSDLEEDSLAATTVLPVRDSNADSRSKKPQNRRGDNPTNRRRDRPQKSEAEAEPMGTIDPRKVNRFIDSRFGQVKACYERRLKNNPTLQGRLDLDISISSKGKVTDVYVNSDTVRDSRMHRCVNKTIRGWQFPKPKGGRVTVGKTFKSKQTY